MESKVSVKVTRRANKSHGALCLCRALSADRCYEPPLSLEPLFLPLRRSVSRARVNVGPFQVPPRPCEQQQV